MVIVKESIIIDLIGRIIGKGIHPSLANYINHLCIKICIIQSTLGKNMHILMVSLRY